MQFTKTLKVSASPDKVWRVFAHDFDNAYQWMASVPHSYGKAVGKQFDGAVSAGRVCELDGNPKGIKASEQFLEYDEAAKTARIRVDFLNTKAVFPVKYNSVRVSVVDAEEDESEMTWEFSSNLKPWAILIWPLVRLGFGVFVGQIMEELKFFVEHDAPHPRKVRATAKLALASNA